MFFSPPGTPVLLHVCCAPCSGAIIEALCGQDLRPTVFWSNSNILSADENERRLAVLRPYAAKFGVPVVVDDYDHAAWLDFVREQLSLGLDCQNSPKTQEAQASDPGLPSFSAKNASRPAPIGRPHPDSLSGPERGPRCLMCFRYRLLRAARYAAANGFACLATSLASSRWKSLEQVDAAGRWVVAIANSEAASRSAQAGFSPSPLPAAAEPAAASRPDAPAVTPDPIGRLLWWPQNWRKGGLQPRRDAIIREQNFYNQTFCGCEYSVAHHAAKAPASCPAPTVPPVTPDPIGRLSESTKPSTI